MKQQGAIFSKIIVPVIFLAIVAYLVVSAWMGLRNPYSFVPSYTDGMEDSVQATGWVVRSEQPVNGGEGLVQLKRNQGERVGKGQPIAVVYQDEAYVEHQEELLQTRSDLTAQQYATYAGSPSGAVLEEQMISAMTNLRTAASSGNYTNLSDQTETYRKLVLRREFLVSSEAAAEMTQAASELYKKYETLQSYQSGATTIEAADSGIFSSDLDGYEALLTPAKLEGLSPDELAAFSELTPAADNSCLGKLITGTVWYYAVTLPGEYANQFTTGADVDIYFNSLSDTVEMEVYSVGEVQKDEVVIVFRSAQDEDRSAELRQESCRILFHSSEGIHIPKEALRVDDDGNAGVFIVSGYVAKFRPVEILTEDEDSYLVKANPANEEDKRILRSGDEVILTSAELYDGKVVR